MGMNTYGWCPIISSITSEGQSHSKCTTDDCAWWDNEDDCCVVFAISKHVRKITNGGTDDLNDINRTLSDINNTLTDMKD